MISVVALAKAASILGPVVPHIIQGVEYAFGRGKGKEKKEASTTATADILEALREAGLLEKIDPKGQLGLEAVGSIVESVFRAMKANKELDEGKEPATVDVRADIEATRSPWTKQVIIRGTIEEV